MNRGRILLGAVSLGLVVIAILAILACHPGARKVTVSFVNSEASHGQFPSYLESERLAFAARNTELEPASVYVLGIEDKPGHWVVSHQELGRVGAGRSSLFYLYLPQGTHPSSLRLSLYMKASPVRKAQYALRCLIEKARGKYPLNQLWFDGLEVPLYEFVVKLGNNAEPNGAANQSQPRRTNDQDR